jgi:hypothetical protein
MDANRFDRISKLFAQRRALQAGTPEAADQSSQTPKFLFVQTFRAGAITPAKGAEGRYTLSLEAGDGQTVYFSNRPDRLVGAEPTNDFIDHLGFPADNPPNAALIFEAEPGNIDVAVVELYAPVHDDVSGGMTYEVAPLGNWQAELGVELQEAPTDLAAASSFGAAHLFIDGLLDCPGGEVVCRAYGSGQVLGTIPGDWFNNFCSHSLWADGRSYDFCVPCGTPSNLFSGPPSRDWKGDLRDIWSYWGNVCNERIPACNGNCRPTGWCEPNPFWQTACPNY